METRGHVHSIIVTRSRTESLLHSERLSKHSHIEAGNYHGAVVRNAERVTRSLAMSPRELERGHRLESSLGKHLPHLREDAINKAATLYPTEVANLGVPGPIEQPKWSDKRVSRPPTHNYVLLRHNSTKLIKGVQTRLLDPLKGKTLLKPPIPQKEL